VSEWFARITKGKNKNMKTPHLKLIGRSPLRCGLFLIPLVLAWFALSPTVRAVVPAPDGGYPNQNTAEGEDALFSLTTGINNTAIGFQALHDNTTGNQNTANGDAALTNNTIGYGNTANGEAALFSNQIGSYNTAIGLDALFSNTGDNNTATGVGALGMNTTGINNTASGFQALELNTAGDNNTAIGFNALFSNTTGDKNTAVGNNALLGNTTGSFNIAVGNAAGGNLTTGINNIDIGNSGVAGETKTIRIGKQGTQTATFIAGISGVSVPAGVGVIVGTDGKLGTVVSSARFKEAIKPMDKASEAIFALKPATFRYKKELDPDCLPQFGLVAEDVEKVNPDLIARDDEGKPYTVRYEAVNAMLLNEFLKEHRTVQQQGARIAEQQKQIEALTAMVQEQATQIQKVSDQLALSKSVPRVVVNDP
jgi:hypothetical protein